MEFYIGYLIETRLDKYWHILIFKDMFLELCLFVANIIYFFNIWV